LARQHAPLAQGVLCVLDVWHCLAKQSVEIAEEVDELTILVLLGEMVQNPKKLCCMEAHLLILQKLGANFFYRIDHCVKFPAKVWALKVD
jgi:hypothetical protein